MYHSLMLTFKLLLLFTFYGFTQSDENEKPVLYYYGLEESERSLSACGPQQACSAFIERYWRPPALVRLCRCGRRRRCDTRAAEEMTIEINNRAHLQFCKNITDWPDCSIDDLPLKVVSSYDRMNPDDLEEQHHQDIQLVPPNITLNCKCRNNNYWKLNSTVDSIKYYQCASLPLCMTGEFCGNVNYDMNALYQSCLCPKHHICVHNGGVTHLQISEVLYEGRGWRAYCQKVGNDFNDDDY